MPEPTAALTIDQLVRSRAVSYGDKPMVIDPAARITYRELDTTTRGLAAIFIEAGVTKGTRVGLIMPNNTRWVQVAIALTRVGCCWACCWPPASSSHNSGRPQSNSW